MSVCERAAEAQKPLQPGVMANDSIAGQVLIGERRKELVDGNVLRIVHRDTSWMFPVQCTDFRDQFH